MTDIGGRLLPGWRVVGTRTGHVRMEFIAMHKMMSYAGGGANAEYGEHSEL
jgi:hypothetical protein